MTPKEANIAIYETYYERMLRLEKGDTPDVYVYNEFPDTLKHQIIHIWDNAFWRLPTSKVQELYTWMERTTAAGIGIAKLTKHSDPSQSCKAWFLEMPLVEPGLSIVELSALMMGAHNRNEFVDDLNFRFRQNGIGYQIENHQIIKINDEFVHAEIVKPALGLLASAPVFNTANADFMAAHAHYGAGENKQAVTLACSAFESTLKAICKMKSWNHEPGATASQLITTIRAKGLFPGYLDKGFDSYIAAMKTGLPGVRNDAGAHGSAPGARKCQITLPPTRSTSQPQTSFWLSKQLRASPKSAHAPRLSALGSRLKCSIKQCDRIASPLPSHGRGPRLDPFRPPYIVPLFSKRKTGMGLRGGRLTVSPSVDLTCAQKLILRTTSIRSPLSSPCRKTFLLRFFRN